MALASGQYLSGGQVYDADGREVVSLEGSPASNIGHNVTTIGDGRTVVTTTGTRVVLATSTPAKYVTITAALVNTGIIVVGGTTVVASVSTRRGTPLNAGDTITLPVDNLNDVNVDATVSGEAVVFTYVN